MSSFEEDWRTVHNFVAEFASVANLLPILEHARDAEKFLADSDAIVKARSEDLNILDATLKKKAQELLEIQQRIRDAKQEHLGLQASVDRANQDFAAFKSELNEKYASEKAAFKEANAKLAIEHDNLVAQLKSLEKESVGAAQTLSDLKDRIRKADAALQAVTA